MKRQPPVMWKRRCIWKRREDGNTEGGRKEVDDIYRKEVDAEVEARVYAEKVDMVKRGYENGGTVDFLALLTQFSVEKVREILGLKTA